MPTFPPDAAPGEPVPTPDTSVPAPPVDLRFGSRPLRYPDDTIFPRGEPGAHDDAIRRLYDQWKTGYLTVGCGGAYVRAPGGSGGTARVTNSQIHGLGMLIVALLNGHDPEAQAIFDGMVAVYRRFPSYLEVANGRPGNGNLMAYGFAADCGQVMAPDAQTDGDQPIALALLAAHRVWGSGGGVDYLTQARATIAAMKAYEMNPRSKTPLLGDWCSFVAPGAAPAPFQDATHPADFAFDHFRSYLSATGDPFWMEAIDATYVLVAEFQGRQSPITGLFPEYLLGTSALASPAAAGFLGEPNAGVFTVDALLTLFRLASDYVVAGRMDPRGKAALLPVNRWIRGVTGNDPARIARGYQLDGTVLTGGPAPEFEAAFAAAAMVDPANQAWLDALWTRMSIPTLTGNSFADSVRLLSMLLVSGNWWVPRSQ